MKIMQGKIGIREALHLKFGIPNEDMWIDNLSAKVVHIFDRGNVDRQAVEKFLPLTIKRVIWERPDEEKRQEQGDHAREQH